MDKLCEDPNTKELSLGEIRRRLSVTLGFNVDTYKEDIDSYIFSKLTISPIDTSTTTTSATSTSIITTSSSFALTTSTIATSITSAISASPANSTTTTTTISGICDTSCVDTTSISPNEDVVEEVIIIILFNKMI